MGTSISLAAMLVAAGAWAVTGTGGGGGGCADVEVVFARGTGEAAGLGFVGDAFVAAVRTALPGDAVDAYAVVYSADAAQTGAGAGAADLTSHVAGLAKICTATTFVVGGYSQGASVADIAVGVGGTVPASEKLPSVLASRVAAVVVFGNPLRPVIGPLTQASSLYGGKAVDFCATGDPVCGSGTSVLAHASYVSNGSTSRAAAFVASKVHKPTAATAAPKKTTPKASPAKSSPAKASSTKAGSTKSSSTKAGTTKSSSTKSGPAKSSPAATNPATNGTATASQSPGNPSPTATPIVSTGIDPGTPINQAPPSPAITAAGPTTATGTAPAPTAPGATAPAASQAAVVDAAQLSSVLSGMNAVSQGQHADVSTIAGLLRQLARLAGRGAPGGVDAVAAQGAATALGHGQGLSFVQVGGLLSQLTGGAGAAGGLSGAGGMSGVQLATVRSGLAAMSRGGNVSYSQAMGITRLFGGGRRW